MPESASELRAYGCQEIEILSEHYFHGIQDIAGRLQAQWLGMKYHLRDVIRPDIPEEVKESKTMSPTEWCLLKLMQNSAVKQLYPDIAYIVEVIVSLPVSNAWPERGASALKSVKTRLRNRLTSSMVESILHICINAPDPTSTEGQHITKPAVQAWIQKKQRRKLPMKKINSSSTCKTSTNQSSVQTDDIVPSKDMISMAVDIALKKLNLDIYQSDN